MAKRRKSQRVFMYVEELGEALARSIRAFTWRGRQCVVVIKRVHILSLTSLRNT